MVLLLFGVGMVVGLLLVGAFRKQEPESGGKKLSGWMEGLSRVNPDTRDPLKEAFRQMGPATNWKPAGGRSVWTRSHREQRSFL